MRFGVFVPQGWRLDLVGIEPAEQWPTMLRPRPGRRRRPLGVDLGLRPLPHRAGADRRGDARGLVADGRVRRHDRRGSGSGRCAPAWATATRPTSPRSPRPRRHLRRPGRDGHRRRLVRARVAGLRLRLPRRRRAARHARRGRADHAPAVDRRARPRWPASTTRSTARSAGRCRCRTAASRCGSPAAARRRRCVTAAKYAQYTNFDATPERLRPQVRGARAATAATSAATSARSPARPTTTSSSAPTEKDVAGQAGLDPRALRAAACRPTSSSATARCIASGPLVGTPEQIVRTPARGREAWA